MNADTLAEIHLRAIERYAEIFDEPEAHAQAVRWWLWAARNLNRQLYEEVRKRRWARASSIEKQVAKAGVPSR